MKVESLSKFRLKRTEIEAFLNVRNNKCPKTFLEKYSKHSFSSISEETLKGSLRSMSLLQHDILGDTVFAPATSNHRDQYISNLMYQQMGCDIGRCLVRQFFARTNKLVFNRMGDTELNYIFGSTYGNMPSQKVSSAAQVTSPNEAMWKRWTPKWTTEHRTLWNGDELHLCGRESSRGTKRSYKSAHYITFTSLSAEIEKVWQFRF